MIPQAPFQPIGSPMSLPNSPFDAFQASLMRDGGTRPMLILPAAANLPYAQGGLRLTYGQIGEAVDQLITQLSSAGYGAGSRVALILENRPEFFIHWLALNAVGASIVPINAEMRPDELAHQMKIAKPDLMITLPQHMPLVEGGCPADLPRAVTGAPLPSAQNPRKAAIMRDPQAECALLFTSGSTGKPKGCMLSNHYFLNVGLWYTQMAAKAAPMPDQVISLTPLPFFHMNALGCNGVGMMMIGGAIVALDRFSASRWWQIVAESEATIVHNLGVIPAILLQLPVTESETRHKARFNFSPGVDAQHRLDFEARFKLPIVEGWAMTETGGTGTIDTAGHDYPTGQRCIGKMREGAEYRIVDEAGQDVPVGTPGELLLRATGPDPRAGFFSGYLGDEAATNEAWADGYFHTGDVVKVDTEGFFYFIDRRKSIIRRSGENISALEVEGVLKADPTIQATAVTPVTDAIRGEEVFAFVVPHADTAFDAQATMAKAATQLSYHKLPGFIAVVEALPLSSTQKLLRGQLRTEAERLIAAGQVIDLTAKKGGFRQPAKAKP